MTGSVIRDPVSYNPVLARVSKGWQGWQGSKRILVYIYVDLFIFIGTNIEINPYHPYHHAVTRHQSGFQLTGSRITDPVSITDPVTFSLKVLQYYNTYYFLQRIRNLFAM